ncbi:MAG: ATP-binding protein [Bdellovibrionales bacterium]|nr:ATP-binding protein [Bdellovibrionales bacterium]
MRIFSFAQDGSQMVPVEVQLSLIPGLPQVQFTGLPDMAIKESIMRIKSAIRAQNFEWPKTRQIIINLRPAHLKKSSQGLELAVACALLWKTEQLPPPSDMSSPFYVYGELSLDGTVSVPQDWESLPVRKEGILTGRIKEGNYLCPLFQISQLRDLENPTFVPVKPITELLQKPPIPDICFSEKAAHILSIVAAGFHSLLLAGEAGSGKSTLSEHLPYLLPPPSSYEFRESRRVWSRMGRSLVWRPFVHPHHSITPLAMIGGGYPLFYGEITKAHGGILFMDEYLEFHPKVQEALREPVERGEICIARRGQSEKFPARFLLVAATNLCPCGDLVPGKSSPCSYSLRRCFSHLERLNGPMLDRFDILAFSDQWKTGNLSVSLKEIYKRVMRADAFRRKRGQKEVNARLSLQELESSLSVFLKETQLSSSISSKRRKKAILKVARTLADLNENESIEVQHIDQAKELSLIPFMQIKDKGMFP